MKCLDAVSDWVYAHFGLIFIVLFGGLMLAVFSLAYLEVMDPCVRRGPQHLLYFQHVGAASFPVYGSDCIERKSGWKR